MSGALVRQHVLELTRAHGREPIDKALAAIPIDAREEIEHAHTSSWARVASFHVFYEALAVETGRPAGELHAIASRVAVERTFLLLWRILLRFTSDASLMARSPAMHARSFDTGTMSAMMVQRGVAQLKLRGWPAIPEFSVRGIRIGIETLLRLSGRHEPSVVSTTVPDGADFRASWKV